MCSRQTVSLFEASKDKCYRLKAERQTVQAKILCCAFESANAFHNIECLLAHCARGLPLANIGLDTDNIDIRAEQSNL